MYKGDVGGNFLTGIERNRLMYWHLMWDNIGFIMNFCDISRIIGMLKEERGQWEGERSRQ